MGGPQSWGQTSDGTETRVIEQPSEDASTRAEPPVVDGARAVLIVNALLHATTCSLNSIVVMHMIRDGV